MKKPLFILTVVALCSLAIELGTFWLRGYDFYYCSLAAFVLYFFFTLWCCRHWRQIAPAKILLAAVIGWCLPYLPLLVFGNLHPAAPIDIAMHVLGMAAGYLFFKARTAGRIAVAVASVALLALEPTFIKATCCYDSFGSVTGRVEPAGQFDPIHARGLDGEAVTLGDDPSKVYVIDCWSSGCGYCLQEFPDFQQFYERYRDDARVEFCALNIGETPEKAALLLAEEGDYTFPTAVCERETALRLGVRVVPTYLIIAGGKLVYRNGLEPLEKRLRELLPKEE